MLFNMSFLFYTPQIRDARNGIMHHGNYSLTDDDMKLCVLNIVDMVEHVLKWPFEQKEKQLYHDMQNVSVVALSMQTYVIHLGYFVYFYN